jgi:hypothetical protein
MTLRLERVDDFGGTIITLVCRDQDAGHLQIISGDRRPMNDFLWAYQNRQRMGDVTEFTQLDDGSLCFAPDIEEN